MTMILKNDARCLDIASLCNKKKPNPILGAGPLKRGDARNEAVKKLQQMLWELNYYLIELEPNKQGVDGKFGGETLRAVNEFQNDELQKDWEGKKLGEDKLVGPRTADSLNRALVGFWYDFYETDKRLTGEKRVITVSRRFFSENGLTIEKVLKGEEIKLIIKDQSSLTVPILLEVSSHDYNQDQFQLVSADGSYDQTLKSTDAIRYNEKMMVLRFKDVPLGKQFSLFQHLTSDTKITIFMDVPLTSINDFGLGTPKPSKPKAQKPEPEPEPESLSGDPLVMDDPADHIHDSSWYSPDPHSEEKRKNVA